MRLSLDDPDLRRRLLAKVGEPLTTQNLKLSADIDAQRPVISLALNVYRAALLSDGSDTRQEFPVGAAGDFIESER